MTKKTVALSSCLISLLYLTFLGHQAFAAPLTAPKHIAVIDAGSSGTRLYLYEVKPDGTIKTELSNFEYKDEDGIDNYVCDSVYPQSDVMKVVITPLLTKLKQQAKANGFM